MSSDPMDVEVKGTSSSDLGKGKGKGRMADPGAPGPTTSAAAVARLAHREAARQTLPWVEKYRPSTLDELVAHEDIVSILQKLIDSNKLPHLLFYGPPGTGKTSTILACAKKLYGADFKMMVLELNASDDRGIDVVRGQIKEFAGTKRLFSSGVKLVILDEADAMTNDAQFALRRVIEKYTKHTRFCMICNYVNKIIPALQSRCTKFRFAPLKPSQIQGRLQHVVDQEKVSITPDGVEAVMRLGQGDMRRVLNLLQSTHMAYQKVDERHAYLCAAAPLKEDMEYIRNALLTATFKDAFDGILKLTTAKGYSLGDIVQELALIVMDIELPAAVMVHLLDEMSNTEERLAHGGSERLQLGSLVGAFATARYMMSPAS
ncbi:unnamed protein product [Scytosiphon promiscuus]